MVEIGDRLRKLAEERGLPDAEMAARLGVTQRAYRNYLKDERHPSYDALITISKIHAVSLDFILTGCESPHRPRPMPLPADDARFVPIPRRDASLAAGAGFANGIEPVVGHVGFERAWLRRLGVRPDAACVVTIHGASMLPTLAPGSDVLVDTARTALAAGRIYALRDDDGGARVKRLWPNGPRGAMITSDNPSEEFPPELDPHGAARIVGLVVWAGTAIRYG